MNVAHVVPPGEDTVHPGEDALYPAPRKKPYFASSSFVRAEFRARSSFSDSGRDSRIFCGVRVFHQIGDGGAGWREPTARICVIV